MTKKRWLSLFVENEIGTLARIAGLFSGKSYNLNSLTVGTTEDPTVSRMTIGLTSDDRTFEQIKKQLNRSVEVIRVVDFTDAAIHSEELMFVKIRGCSAVDLAEIERLCLPFAAKILESGADTVLLESVQAESRNNDWIALLQRRFPGRLEIVRGGSVAIETIGGA